MQKEVNMCCCEQNKTHQKIHAHFSKQTNKCHGNQANFPLSKEKKIEQYEKELVQMKEHVQDLEAYISELKNQD